MPFDDYKRDRDMSPTLTPSWATAGMYYWGGRTDANEAGDFKEVWHTSFKNPEGDHNIVLFFNRGGEITKQVREEGY